MRDERQGEFELLASTTAKGGQDLPRVFQPGRLTQARVLAEMSKADLAEVLHVSAAAVGQYEAGAISPRSDLIPELARVLKVPVEFFGAGRPLGRVDAADAHFRSLRSTRAKDRAKAATHAEQVWELTHALEKRIRLPYVDMPDVAEGTAPDTAARLLRQAWSIGRGPVAHLVATMEAHGIVTSLVALTDAAITRVSAYSTWVADRPLVIVTPERATSVFRYRFTCAHEVGHLLLHPTPRAGDRIQEAEADAFAAEFLTPREEIEPLLPRTIRLGVLTQIAATWGVSTSSLVRRMEECRVVSEISVRRAYQRLNSSVVTSDDPVTNYPGEMPSLLREALSMAEQHGLTRSALATELCWTTRHLSEVLGEADTRPTLRLVHGAK